MFINSGTNQHGVTYVGDNTPKSVGDPSPQYESLKLFYERARAVLGGQDTAKAYDDVLDTSNFGNLLLPFSPKMSWDQYTFYKAEAELPGLCSQYSRVLVGGLLRKSPQLGLPEGIEEDALEWLTHDFTGDGRGLVGFLDEALREEVTTSRAWVAVSFPYVPEGLELTPAQQKELKPFPVLFKAESVINWKEGINPLTRRKQLTRVIIRQLVEKPDVDNEFHDKLVDTVMVHEITPAGIYQIRTYEFVAQSTRDDAQVIAGEYRENYKVENGNESWELVATDIPLSNGAPLPSLPIFPLNGTVQPTEPLLMPLINREIALYNKISRRNHLMYGAATYTPVVSSDMNDEEFEEVVAAGLGSWLKVRDGESIDVLDTPTNALKDMDRAIDSATVEMGRMGIRMLTPDVRDQSGVALEIRNAGQTAQLGTLNVKVSNVMARIIATMLNWRYGSDYESNEINFELSADFNPAPLGADWLRLVTEWYDAGMVPRSLFIDIMKANDIIPPNYDDEAAKTEIMEDELITGPPTNVEELDMEALAQKTQNQGAAEDANL
jgi:hypothetical protein